MQLHAERGRERLVKTVHEVLSLLERHGHVYSMKLKPSFVGVSPLNRDGNGINPVDVHDLLGDIVTSGWLDSRVTAIGVEPSCEQELLWNHDFFKHAENMLGTMDTSQIKALSLAGSHTTAVLRCFAQELPHEGDEMVTHKGKLNLELLRRRDPDFFRAVQDGALASLDVAQQRPQLLSLVQRMGNATLQRGEHEVQLTRRLHGMWKCLDSATPWSLARMITCSGCVCRMNVAHGNSYMEATRSSLPIAKRQSL